MPNAIFFVENVSHFVPTIQQELLYIEVDEDEDDGARSSQAEQGRDESSSDDNDSTAAAHAAAVGHSPGHCHLAKSEPTGQNLSSAEENTNKEENKVKRDCDMMDTEETGAVQASEPRQRKEDCDAVAPADAISETAVTAEATPRPKKLERNYDVSINEKDYFDQTALHVAIMARKIDHVKILLEADCSLRIKCDGSWPMHVALSIGAIASHRQFAYECFVALHERGADIAAKDDSLHTPLFLACMFNLPQIASYILSDADGLATLNMRADRAGNRPIHAAAKFDTLDNANVSKTAVANATGQLPDGSTMASSSGKKLTHMTEPIAPTSGATAPSSATDALLTQVLLGTNGIEVDAVNVMGRTPLHTACSRGNWAVVRLLLQAGASTTIKDKIGLSPGQLSYKRGMPIPNDLADSLGEPPAEGVVAPPRDLIVDPHGKTMLMSHELCLLHRTCPPMRRSTDADSVPPENVRRLQVLVDDETGILRTGEFGGLSWRGEARRAAIADVLKVHEYEYIDRISQQSSIIPDYPNAIANLDADTAISRWSFEAAMRAAGSVCEAVDRVIAGEARNAFCAVRPPGHHAGPRGIVRCANDPEGSHGFCLLNNVAIGAAYARSMYRNEGIQKIAIIDFDVHHGNGTEEIVRRLIPKTETTVFRTPFSSGELRHDTYKPWLDETDVHNVFFSSTHGYGQRGVEQRGHFYPASGKSHTSDALSHPNMVETPGLADFMLSQTWTRIGEDARTNCCKIIDVGFELPESDSDPQSRSMKQRLDLRDAYRKNIFPHLLNFDPDLIFISAGFDAHRRDTMNFGYVGMVEEDYEWVTEHLVQIANSCCNGRVVSVLEGGYKIQGGIVSPFARSVASHVRALVDGGRSRELYDPNDSEFESTFERGLFERRERKKELEREQLRAAEAASRLQQRQEFNAAGEPPEDPDVPSRKRRRNQVDYKELLKDMQREGFAD